MHSVSEVVQVWNPNADPMKLFQHSNYGLCYVPPSLALFHGSNYTGEQTLFAHVQPQITLNDDIAQERARSLKRIANTIMPIYHQV